MKKTKKGIAVLLLVAMLFSMSITNVFATETSEPKVYTTGTNTLNLEGEFAASGYDAAIYVHSGAKLTINGEGKVHALADNGGSGDSYATTVWANGKDSEITINGGTYTNQGIEGDDHFDLIYAKDGGKIVINGGTFKCATPKWTLNLHDSLRGEIVVKGGTFYKFNPADAQTEPGEEHFNYVAPGYGVIKEGDWYTVIKTEYASGTNTLNLSKDITANGFDAAIYVHSGAKLTINGEGKVHAYADNGGSGDKYATTVWANGEGSEITINGGTYTNQGVEGDDHFDLIYAKAGGKVLINGGTFKCATPKWTLNLHDTQRGEIVVKGGTFYKFNPADAQTEPGEEHFNYVAPGYRVIQDGDWYTVCKIKEAEAAVSNNVANAEKVEEMVIETLKEAIAADSELAKEIEGKSIEVEVEVKPVEVNKSEKETIETEAAKKVEDIKVAEYIDISIVVKDVDTDEEITKLSTVKEVIKFTVEVPEELKTGVAEGYTRIFYIIRNHNGIIDVLETKEADGKLTFESDKFSTYAIAYKDVKDSTPPTEGEVGEAIPQPEAKPEVKPELPDPVPTGDNVVIFAVLAVVAMAGMAVTIKMRKK